jgi:N-acetyl-D-muramate 6-phosphate phosphatase
VPLDIPRIRAICFDVDGTLSDTDDYYVARLSRWVRAIPLISDPTRLARRLVMWIESPGNAMLGLADALNLDTAMISAIDWIYRHRRPQNRPFPVIEGVADVLRELHATFPTAVVSSRDEDSTMAFLDQSHLTDEFDVIITALSAEHTKPYPDPIRLAARKLGVDPAACLMVGDTTVDVRAGRAAGSQTVGVLCGFGEDAELRRQQADLILPTTADLARILLPAR